jgi:hypothetical protein
MMLQYRVSSRKIRLQAQEFVAFRRLNQARLRNLATPFVPDLQRVLTLFEQPLCRVLWTLKQKSAFRRLGSGTKKGLIPISRL